MKVYIKNLLLFFVVFFVICVVSVITSNMIVLSILERKDDVDVLVLGDSHTQNGVNLNAENFNSLNLSTSSEAYFFSYNKTKYFIDNKINVKKIVLAFGPYNLSKSIDTNWIFNESNFLAKTRSYWPLIARNTIPDFVEKSNFSNLVYVKLLAEILYQSFFTIERYIFQQKEPFIGGYTPNTYSMNFDESVYVQPKFGRLSFSEVQINYLQEIIILCNKNEIELILLNTPNLNGTTVGKLPKLKGEFQVFDYGDLFKFQTGLFADYSHLNPKGAQVFSDTLWKRLTGN